MAVTSGTVFSVTILKSRGVQPIQCAEILFTMSGTYAQADNSTLTGLAALIQGSTRNGRTVTLLGVMQGQAATSQADGSYMGIKTVAISSADATFELTGSDFSTELSNGAIPAQAEPFGILVAYTENG